MFAVAAHCVYRNSKMKKDLFIIFVSIVIAVMLAQTGALHELLEKTKDFGVLQSFVAGFFFTSVFTVAPATVAVAELSRFEPVFSVAFFGGLGAAVSDMIIYLFVRKRLSKDVTAVIGKIVGRFKYRALVRSLDFKPIRWINPILGALIIASPLPDEIGLAFLGFSKIRPVIVMPLVFLFNSLGILAVGLVAQAL